MKTLINSTILAAAVMASGLTAQAGTITAKGSDTLVILAQKWAEVYMSKNPGTTIQVTGGGSGTGFAALQNQATDLANASRKIKPQEQMACVKAFNKIPREYKVCMDGLSVYVNADNPLKELSLDQLQGIFTGRIKTWKELGGGDGLITIYSRENSSGTYEFFKEHVLKGKDFASAAQPMQGTAQVLESISKDKGGIGYGGAAYGAGARALAIKSDANSPAIEPTEDNVVGQKYPIWRYLFIYVNPAVDKGEVATYLKWIRGDEGQKVVKDVGYFPLPKNFRE